jgi:hypothetical protein
MSSATKNEIQIDEAKSQAFAERLVGALNSAGVVSMTSIGHRTGLFDAMSMLAPSTSEQIAQSAQLNERYVREWLGAMVTGGIVEYDPETGNYAPGEDTALRMLGEAGFGNVELHRLPHDVMNCFYVARR